MYSSIKKFSLFLKEIKYPNKKDDWDIEGIIHQKTNRLYKFDLSPIKKFKENDYGKIGYFNTKAEKMVFDFKDNWIVLDIEELNEYVKSTDKRDFNIDELLDNLSWNLILSK